MLKWLLSHREKKEGGEECPPPLQLAEWLRESDLCWVQRRSPELNLQLTLEQGVI